VGCRVNARNSARSCWGTSTVASSQSYIHRVRGSAWGVNCTPMVLSVVCMDEANVINIGCSILPLETANTDSELRVGTKI